MFRAARPNIPRSAACTSSTVSAKSPGFPRKGLIEFGSTNACISISPDASWERMTLYRRVGTATRWVPIVAVYPGGRGLEKIAPVTIQAVPVSEMNCLTCDSSRCHIPRFSRGRCGVMFDRRNVVDMARSLRVKSPAGAMWPRSNPLLR